MDNTDMDLRQKSLLEFKKIANNLHNYAIIDTETTGFPSHTNSEVWQIGAITFNEAGVPLKHSWFMRPSLPIPDVVVELTGICADDLKGMPSFREVYGHFLNIIGNRHIIAYNSEFDVPMIDKTAKARVLARFNPMHTCVMKLYANFAQVEWNTKYHNWKWVKLSETNWEGIPSAMVLEGLSVEGAHCAIDDCVMTWKLIEKVASYELDS